MHPFLEQSTEGGREEERNLKSGPSKILPQFEGTPPKEKYRGHRLSNFQLLSLYFLSVYLGCEIFRLVLATAAISIASPGAGGVLLTGVIIASRNLVAIVTIAKEVMFLLVFEY